METFGRAWLEEFWRLGLGEDGCVCEVGGREREDIKEERLINGGVLCVIQKEQNTQSDRGRRSCV